LTTSSGIVPYMMSWSWAGSSDTAGMICSHEYASSISCSAGRSYRSWLYAVSQACFAVSFQRGAANRCSVASRARLITS